jgi:hypothetical protein
MSAAKPVGSEVAAAARSVSEIALGDSGAALNRRRDGGFGPSAFGLLMIHLHIGRR